MSFNKYFESLDPEDLNRICFLARLISIRKETNLDQEWINELQGYVNECLEAMKDPNYCLVGGSIAFKKGYEIKPEIYAKITKEHIELACEYIKLCKQAFKR